MSVMLRIQDGDEETLVEVLKEIRRVENERVIEEKYGR